MSIVALKKKTAAKYNNMSVGVSQFSINGGHRNQGWVGQTSLSRSIPKTPMRGPTPRGHGGCCGTYPNNMIIPPVTSTNDNTVMKSTVKTTDGMMGSRNMWAKRPAPYSTVKPDNNHNLNGQSDYIARKTKKAINEVTPTCPAKEVATFTCPANMKNSMFKNRINTPYNNSCAIKKEVGPLDSSAYIAKLGDECVSADVEYQERQNNKNSSTPFGC